jgi:cell division protein FtsQ
MDGRGRLAQSLTWLAHRGRGRTARAPMRHAQADLFVPDQAVAGPSHVSRIVRRCWTSLLHTRVPRGIGIASAAFIILGSLAYGVVKGDHVPAVIDSLKDARDQAANAAGFRIVSVAITGNRHVSREEILAIAGVTGRSSLLFLDVDDVRNRLKQNPWIADATVLKLYPGELQIGTTERKAFALWQKDRRVSVIAADGTVLEPYVAPSLVQLPLVVGRGAESRAKDFIALMDRHPDLREQVRAAILVGERRWNLRLKNGLDVRLPEAEVARALERLVALDREAKLMSRDITAIDLRLPDRVTVRLSPAAAEARAEAVKDKKTKKKGGSA